VYFNVNLKLLTKLIDSAFVGEGTTYMEHSSLLEIRSTFRQPFTFAPPAIFMTNT